MASAWETLKEKITELEALTGVIGVLEWDQQVMMPRSGAAARGEQLAALSAVAHQRLTDPRLGEAIAALQDDEDPLIAAAVRRVGRRHRRAVRVPGSLVAAFARAQSEGFNAWLEARALQSFAVFQPALQRLIDLVREVAACHAPVAHPYDALLEEYDPGASTAALVERFGRLEAGLVPFVAACADRPAPEAVRIPCSCEDTLAISLRVATALGWREAEGRLDISEHPFTVGLAPGDVRITTKPNPDDLFTALFGTIHEAGHAMYEQGLPVAWRGTGLCDAAGTGLHESQSRFWENCIGRSLPFARWLHGILRERWPDLAVGPEALYRSFNGVRRTLIRVHADEATYNLHVLVRFGLERAIVAGALDAAALPEAWDDAYARILGVRPLNPVEGVLQDVHWSSGAFGYFPSYTLGNLYAAGLAEALEEQVPDLWQGVERGDFAPILAWLRENVHSKGAMYEADEIYVRAAGGRDPVDAFLRHLRRRQGVLYGVS